MKFKKAIFVILSYILVCFTLSSCCIINHVVSEGVVESKACVKEKDFRRANTVFLYKIKISGKCFYCEKDTTEVYNINKEVYDEIKVGDYFYYSDWCD